MVVLWLSAHGLASRTSFSTLSLSVVNNRDSRGSLCTLNSFRAILFSFFIYFKIYIYIFLSSLFFFPFCSLSCRKNLTGRDSVLSWATCGPVKRCNRKLHRERERESSAPAKGTVATTATTVPLVQRLLKKPKR